MSFLVLLLCGCTSTLPSILAVLTTSPSSLVQPSQVHLSLSGRSNQQGSYTMVVCWSTPFCTPLSVVQYSLYQLSYTSLPLPSVLLANGSCSGFAIPMCFFVLSVMLLLYLRLILYLFYLLFFMLCYTYYVFVLPYNVIFYLFYLYALFSLPALLPRHASLYLIMFPNAYTERRDYTLNLSLLEAWILFPASR